MQVLSRLNKLTLDVQQIEERAKEREAREGKVEAPTYIKFSYKFLCWVLDAIYEGRPIQVCSLHFQNEFASSCRQRCCLTSLLAQQ